MKPPLGAGYHNAHRNGGKLSRQWRAQRYGLSDSLTDAWFNMFCTVQFANGLSDETRQMIEGHAIKVIPISDEEGGKWIRECEGAAVLVRPDFYIFSSISDETELYEVLGYLRSIKRRSM